MRILVVIYEFPPVGGGGGHAAREICRELARRGHAVHVLTAHFTGLPRRENQNGVEIIRVPSARQTAYQAGLLPMAGFVMAGLWTGLGYARQWRPDILHVHFAVPSGPVAWAIARLTGIPYVLTAHLGDVPHGVPEKTDGWFRWIFPFTPPIWRNAAQVVAVSEHTRQLAAQYYPVNIQVVPNGVDLGELSPGAISIGKPPLIVFAGRFMLQKNPLQLVRTLAELKHLDWHCSMVGNGPLMPEVTELIRASGLEERITLPGWVTPEEVTEWLGKGDILFMPSLTEGLPVVGVKAVAKGLAIVASRIGGFLDIVDEGKNGYLVDLQEVEKFGVALEELLTDPERLAAFRKASLAKSQEFDIHKVVDAYEKIFERNAGKGSGINPKGV